MLAGTYTYVLSFSLYNDFIGLPIKRICKVREKQMHHIGHFLWTIIDYMLEHCLNDWVCDDWSLQIR